MLGRSFIMASFPSCSVLWSDGIPLVHLLKSPVGTIMATLHPDNLRSRQTLPSFWWLHCLGCIVFAWWAFRLCPSKGWIQRSNWAEHYRTKLDRDPVCGKGHVLSPGKCLQVANNNWCLQTTVWTWVVLRMAKAWSGELIPVAHEL